MKDKKEAGLTPEEHWIIQNVVGAAAGSFFGVGLFRLVEWLCG